MLGEPFISPSSSSAGHRATSAHLSADSVPGWSELNRNQCLSYYSGTSTQQQSTIFQFKKREARSSLGQLKPSILSDTISKIHTRKTQEEKCRHFKTKLCYLSNKRGGRGGEGLKSLSVLPWYGILCIILKRLPVLFLQQTVLISFFRNNLFHFDSYFYC